MTHPSHQTRYSDSSFYDEVCTSCGATDADGDQGLRFPCGGLQVGDEVEKLSGYKWPGKVVSIFKTLQGHTRVVVECTVPEVSGALHIYNLEQLKLTRSRRDSEI